MNQCSSTRDGLSFESCAFGSAPAGDYWIRIDNPNGHSGDFQIAVAGLDLVPTWTPTITPTPTLTPSAMVTPTQTATPTATKTPGPCTPLDVDDDGQQEPLTDGLLFLRFAFGFTGSTLTAGALGGGAMRDAGEIGAYLSSCGTTLDIDGNGEVRRSRTVSSYCVICSASAATYSSPARPATGAPAASLRNRALRRRAALRRSIAQARTPTTSRYSASTMVRFASVAWLFFVHSVTRSLRNSFRSGSPSVANARVVGP